MTENALSSPLPWRFEDGKIICATGGIVTEIMHVGNAQLIMRALTNLIAIDPYTEFTHKDAALDRLKKVVLLQQQKILLVFIEGARLVGGDFEVIESALKGRDESQRALGI